MSIGNFMKQMATDDFRKFRDTALNADINGLTLDTCFTPDTDKWETGIRKDGTWIIVEMYDSKDDAIKGHKKWCDKVKKDKDIELKNCITSEQWAFGDY